MSPHIQIELALTSVEQAIVTLRRTSEALQFPLLSWAFVDRGARVLFQPQSFVSWAADRDAHEMVMFYNNVIRIRDAEDAAAGRPRFIDELGKLPAGYSRPILIDVETWQKTDGEPRWSDADRDSYAAVAEIAAKKMPAAPLGLVGGVDQVNPRACDRWLNAGRGFDFAAPFLYRADAGIAAEQIAVAKEHSAHGNVVAFLTVHKPLNSAVIQAARDAGCESFCIWGRVDGPFVADPQHLAMEVLGT